jgi:aspartate kinase
MEDRSKRPAQLSVAAAARRIGFEPPRGVSRIEWHAGLAHLAIKTEEGGRALASVFRPLMKAGVSVDMVKLLPPGICFTLSEDQIELTGETLRKLGLEFVVTPQCAVLTVYAPDMRSLPGIMATVVGALDNNGVRVLSTDDSYNSIFCVIHRDDGPRACQALADEFDLDLKNGEGPSVEW